MFLISSIYFYIYSDSVLCMPPYNIPELDGNPYYPELDGYPVGNPYSKAGVSNPPAELEAYNRYELDGYPVGNPSSKTGVEQSPAELSGEGFEGDNLSSLAPDARERYILGIYDHIKDVNNIGPESTKTRVLKWFKRTYNPSEKSLTEDYKKQAEIARNTKINYEDRRRVKGLYEAKRRKEMFKKRS